MARNEDYIETINGVSFKMILALITQRGDNNNDINKIHFLPKKTTNY